MGRSNVGNDFACKAVGGDLVGDTGTTTSAPGATTVTDTGKSWTTNAWAGHVVTMAGVYMTVVSNTATVLTGDQWHTPATPGGSAATTPSSGTYQILPGQHPAWYMALTANSTAPASGDTTLTGEITTAGGGLVRKIATYAHTGSASSYTLTGAFTANGSDSLPVTIAKDGIFQHYPSGGNAHLQTLLNATATLSASGDPVTITHTVTV